MILTIYTEMNVLMSVRFQVSKYAPYSYWQIKQFSFFKLMTESLHRWRQTKSKL